MLEMNANEDLTDLVEEIEAAGYECYSASVGPLSSNWDRACELYAQLMGTTVDYGAAHAAKHNHSRYGRTYKKPLGEEIPGEKLNLLVGSRPLVNEADGIKLNVLRILNEKYGICEEDFLSAELSAVPVGNARDVGLDRSMICAYGHDDRVCAYPAMTAMFEALKMGTPHTMMCILADKEETGSDGNTGMQSELFLDIIKELSDSLGANTTLVKANSKCLSADVSACYDPNFAGAYEKRNSSMLSCSLYFGLSTPGVSENTICISSVFKIPIIR